MFTVFLSFLPNRFRLNMEPHELVWKSVTAILHRISVSIFKVFSTFEIHWTTFQDFCYILDPWVVKHMCFWVWWRSIFWHFVEVLPLTWDLSRSVRMVFRSPGNPLINLFHFIFNSRCHFLEVSFFIQLPIVLPIVSPHCDAHGLH